MIMEMEKASIVISSAGRDEGQMFFVLDTQGDTLLLADGKRRRVEAPKRKKVKHVTFLRRGEGSVADKIRSNEKITNSELRRAIAAQCGGNQDQEEN